MLCSVLGQRTDRLAAARSARGARRRPGPSEQGCDCARCTGRRLRGLQARGRRDQQSAQGPGVRLRAQWRVWQDSTPFSHYPSVQPCGYCSGAQLRVQLSAGEDDGRVVLDAVLEMSTEMTPGRWGGAAGGALVCELVSPLQFDSVTSLCGK